MNNPMVIPLLTLAVRRWPQLIWWIGLVFCFLIWAWAGLLFSRAEAAHCRKGQLYRVSMHRCVGAGSKLGREVRPHRRSRYARLEEREVKVQHRRFRRSRPVVEAKPKDEKPAWFLDILLPDDGSIPIDSGTPRTEQPKTETPVPDVPQTATPNPQWPPNWADWYAPRHLTGP